MAGNIQKVNLQQLLNDIAEYQTLVANELNIKCMREFQNDFTKLTQFWTGKRINSIITKWNNNVTSISNAMKYFNVTIAGILYEIYDQYQSMEQGAPKDESIKWDETVYEVKRIPLTNESTIKYDKVNVNKITHNLELNFVKTKINLGKIITKLDSMQAYSDSLKKVAIDYKSNATKIQSLLNTISNNLNEEVRKAVKDVEVTEQYNEKDARRAATTTKQ